MLHAYSQFDNLVSSPILYLPEAFPHFPSFITYDTQAITLFALCMSIRIDPAYSPLGSPVIRTRLVILLSNKRIATWAGFIRQLSKAPAGQQHYHMILVS